MRYVFWMLSDAAKADNPHYRQELKHNSRDQRAVCFASGLPVGPVSLSTTPVPLRKPRARHERHLQWAARRGGLPSAARRRGCAPASFR